MNDHSDQARELFGDAQTEDYIRSAKALRAYVVATRSFMSAPSGSLEEVMAEMVVTAMSKSLEDKPAHAVNLLETAAGILAMVEDKTGLFSLWLSAIGLSLDGSGPNDGEPEGDRSEAAAREWMANPGPDIKAERGNDG